MLAKSWMTKRFAVADDAGTVPSIEAKAAVGPDFLGGQKLEDGIGLCLSGGGFRAMLFHLGALIRLNELGLLGKLDRVASVSGGSIAAGALAAAWNDLTFDSVGVATNLVEMVGTPLLALACKRLDITAIALGFLPFVHASRVASAAYDKFLFHGKTLQDLPETSALLLHGDQSAERCVVAICP